MLTTITQIGNSKGIRIPKHILVECGFEEKVDISVQNKTLIVKASKPRKTWSAAFKDSNSLDSQEETLVINDQNFDEVEWTW